MVMLIIFYGSHTVHGTRPYVTSRVIKFLIAGKKNITIPIRNRIMLNTTKLLSMYLH